MRGRLLKEGGAGCTCNCAKNANLINHFCNFNRILAILLSPQRKFDAFVVTPGYGTYHHPSTFHHASPNTAQIHMVAADTTNPSLHQSRWETKFAPK